MPHPIEEQSYRILSTRLDFESFDDESAEIIARVVHSTADLDFAKTMTVTSNFVVSALNLLNRERPIVCDVSMTKFGVNSKKSISAIAEQFELMANKTRSYSSMVKAALSSAPAIFVVGCSPTSLEALLDCEQLLDGSVIVGMPVGFVGAAESKLRLLNSNFEFVTNSGERGGSAAAAAAMNAVIRISTGQRYIKDGRIVEPFQTTKGAPNDLES